MASQCKGKLASQHKFPRFLDSRSLHLRVALCSSLQPGSYTDVSEQADIAMLTNPRKLFSHSVRFLDRRPRATTNMLPNLRQVT